MFYTKKVKRALLAAIGERVHQEQLNTVFSFAVKLQSEIEILKKQVQELNVKIGSK